MVLTGYLQLTGLLSPTGHAGAAQLCHCCVDRAVLTVSTHLPEAARALGAVQDAEMLDVEDDARTELLIYV